jgi:hypothetical protein
MMKERVGRVEEVKEADGLRSPCPGGVLIHPYPTTMWLEEETEVSSNHPARDPHGTTASFQIEFESDLLLSAILMRMVISEGDEEPDCSKAMDGDGYVENITNA